MDLSGLGIDVKLKENKEKKERKKPNMIHLIITQFFLHKDQDYSQIYNFILNHDDKFWTFLTIKDV